MNESTPGDGDTRSQAEATARGDATELRARAARIRARADELVEALGPDHPLVGEALERAAHLDAEAERPGQINLR